MIKLQTLQEHGEASLKHGSGLYNASQKPETALPATPNESSIVILSFLAVR